MCQNNLKGFRVTGHHQPDFKAAAQIHIGVHVYFNDPLWCVYRLRQQPSEKWMAGMVGGGSVSPSFVLVQARWWGIHSIAYAMISRSMTISLFASIKALKINKRAF